MLDAVFDVALEEVVPDTVRGHDNYVVIAQLVTICFGFVAQVFLFWGPVAGGATLIRKIEAVLLLLRFMDCRQLPRRLIIWTQDEVAGITQIYCRHRGVFQRSHDGCAASDLLVCSHAFN